MIAAMLRSYGRYVVPFSLLAALVFAPVLWFAWRLPVPADAERAKALYGMAWTIAGGAWFGQFALVGAVAPAVRGAATGVRLSQLRALGCGVANFLTMALPCAVAVAAIAIGGLVLALPALALVVLLALTAASTAPGLPAPLLDSVAVVRGNLRTVAIAVVAIVAVDQAIAATAYLALARPVSAKPTFDQLAAARDVVRVVAIALVVASPLAATVLATIRVRAGSPRGAS